MVKAKKIFLEEVPVKKIKPYKRNPRKNDAAIDEVISSIKAVGYRTPITVDEDMVILTGHTRLKAIQKLGWETVPFIIQFKDLSEKKKNEYRIRDNKSGEIAGWDFEILTADFTPEELIEFGFTQKDLKRSAVVEDAVPELPKTPRTVRGDIYQLGKHRVLCGDATNLSNVEALMGSVTADMYLSDPPYNVAYVGKTKDALTIQNDKMSDDKFRLFLSDAFKNINVVLKPGAVFYIWHADSEGYNFRGACRDAGWQVRQCLIWKKDAMVMGRQDYHWKHEPCLYGWKDGASHLWSTDRRQTTVLEFARPKRSEEHPTMKPIELFAYQIQNNTKAGDIILDNFLGSGTSLIAAEQTKRVCYGLELDEKYCDVIVQRYVNLTGNENILVNGKKTKWLMSKI